MRKLFYLSLFSSLSAFAGIRLPLKYLEQQRPLSCEASALTMVLQYHGLKVDEADVIKKMPVDHTPRKDGVWGDPNLGFVGDVDGEMGKTGYGIHWKALARTASQWKKTTILENGSLNGLLTHLEQNQPIVIWGIKGSGSELTWKTPQGEKVFARSNEHARVVFGYAGTRKNPKAIWVMDPKDGPVHWPIDKFMENWDSFGRKGIVVHP